MAGCWRWLSQALTGDRKPQKSNFDQMTDMSRPPTSVRHKKFGPSLTATEGIIARAASKLLQIAGAAITFCISPVLYVD